MKHPWTFYTCHANHDAYITERELTREGALQFADHLRQMYGYPVVAYTETGHGTEALFVGDRAQAA